jgi:hypothetical protein
MSSNVDDDINITVIPHRGQQEEETHKKKQASKEQLQ